MGSLSPKRDSVRSKELASPKGVTSLANIVVPTQVEAVKEEEEVVSIPKSSKGCQMKKQKGLNKRLKLSERQEEVT